MADIDLAAPGGDAAALKAALLAILTPDASGAITTTNATAGAVAATYRPPHNSVVELEVSFTARKQGGTDGLVKKATAAFIVDNSGVVTQVGSTLVGSSHVTSGASAWAVGVTTDGTDIHATVTGQAATSIDWVVDIEVTGTAP